MSVRGCKSANSGGLRRRSADLADCPCLVIGSRLTAVTDYGVSAKDVSGPGGAAGTLGLVAADGAARRFLYGFGADGHDIQRGLRLLRLNAVCQNTENGARNQAAVGSAE